MGDRVSGESVTRRLAAIVSADVAGYSRLMGLDEEGTHAALKAHRGELIDQKIASYNGRIVKTTGDGVLLEFPSVVDAVNCAVDIQQGMAERNAAVPDDRRIEFRIGINIGDIIIDGDDIFGDGVNIAARLQEIANPGGLCISGRVNEDVRDRLDLTFECLGARELKNIARPIEVWRWLVDGTPSDQPIGSPDEPLALPDKPSIAVLPFQNMSQDPEQEYFADGIAEDIITALSRVGWFFVIARNSSFTFKGRAVDVKQVARALGVRYVLEGSVRKGGQRLRVTAQLIDAATGNHIWADRYDGGLDDVFDLQDRITESVVGAIEPKLRNFEVGRALRKRPDSLDAYDYLLRASTYVAAFRKSDYEAARPLLEKAIELEPRYATALAYAAWCRAFDVFFNWSLSPAEDTAEGLRLAAAAVAADPEDPTALRIAGFSRVILAREYEAALV